MLKPAEVAAKLALSYHKTSRAGFWASIRRNGIPYVVLNSRTIRFPEVALERWIATRTVGRVLEGRS